MLSLTLWFGAPTMLGNTKHFGEVVGKLVRNVKLVAKLCGKSLGELTFELQHSHSSRSAEQHTDHVFFVVRDLQRQASLLMPHEWRDPEDVLLFVGQVCIVPADLAFRDALTEDEAQFVCRVLTTAEIVEMQWDSDTWATKVINDLAPRLHVTSENTNLEIRYFYNDRTECPLEVTAFGNKHKITSVECCSPHVFLTKDLMFLRRLERARNLFLWAVVPSDWASCANIVEMTIGHACITKGIHVLTQNLRVLVCHGVSSFAPRFEKLHLFELELHGCLVDLQVVANITSLKTLCVSNLQSNNTSIPNQVGLLVNLESLKLVNNKFSGKLPQELRNLPHLKSLVVHDQATLDLTFDPMPRLDLLDLQLVE
jgi:hypothetical protein